MRLTCLIFVSALVCTLPAFTEPSSLRPELAQGLEGTADRDGRTYTLPAPESAQIGIEQRDGRWTLSVRIESPGAAGLQLLIGHLRLADGAALRLYEVDAAGARGRLAAEYHRTGPLNGDAFWSAPVTGPAAELEVALAPGEAGTLPLRLNALRHLTPEGLEKLLAAGADSAAPSESEGMRGFTRFRGAIVPFEVRNGVALFEGDIVIGPASEIQTVSGKDRDSQRESMGITGSYYRWQGGIIPYEIDPTLPNQYRITDAINHWNTQLAGTITFRPRNGEAEYVRFVNTTSSGTCSSYIGNVHLTAQPITIGSNCSTGNVIHEAGHAVGLYHEHTREDRNSFVIINFANIDPAKTSNFSQAISTSDDLGAYDYGSIMHYGATAFSINGLPTIETIPAGIPIGQRTALSAGDIAGARAMYPAAPPPPSGVSVTVASNPAGRQLTVDGVSITAPATFQWAPGSAHTVSAPSVTSGGTRYLFKNWSDGGAQTHTITVPTSAWTLTANFQKQYSVSSSSSNTVLGTVANSPASADTFYNDGLVLTVSATASVNGCFVNWTGVTAPASTPASVTVNQPYSIVGNFQSGSITATPSAFSLDNTAKAAAISVTSNAGCSWTATSNASWITITGGASGTGSGVVTIWVARKNGKSSRTGSISIGSATVTITQQ